MRADPAFPSLDLSGVVAMPGAAGGRTGLAVRLGAVPAAVCTSPRQALRVLEAAVGSAEGHGAVCESTRSAVPAVVFSRCWLQLIQRPRS